MFCVQTSDFASVTQSISISQVTGLKVYRRILGQVYDNEKENWRILTNKEIYASV